jgi:hypothetical protein
MANEAMIRAVRRGFKNAGWESPSDDLVRQIADELEKELEQGKANESVI